MKLGEMNALPNSNVDTPNEARVYYWVWVERPGCDPAPLALTLNDLDRARERAANNLCDCPKMKPRRWWSRILGVT